MTEGSPYAPSGRRSRTDEYRNVGDQERAVSLLAGFGSVLLGLRRGGSQCLLLGGLGGYLTYRGVTGHCPAYGWAGINSVRPGDQGLFERPSEPLRLSAGVTVGRTPEALYQTWRDFTYLPTFMEYISSVRPIGEGRTHWVAETPVGAQLEWDSEVIQDVPNERISWRSLEGADIGQRGEVRFRPAPGDRGTEVEVELEYALPGGRLGTAAGGLVNAITEELVREDLRRFKRLMESGEIPTGVRAAQ